MNELFLAQIEIGPMNNFVYLIGDKKKREVSVVDPAWDVPAIKEAANREGVTITSALITHGHPDHTNGIAALLDSYDIPIYVSKHEASFYKPIGDAIKELDDLDKVKIGNIEIECLHTPGHTPGSQCFLMEGKLIAGDTLFLHGCGRCDLPGGDAEAMYHTLYHKLNKLDANTVIYPGHNYHPRKTSEKLGVLRIENPFLTCHSLEEFLISRIG